MAGLLAQLGGNPFSTVVGQKIEQATDASLTSENWGLNMEICDLINETDEGPKDAIKAIKKRLQQNTGKNFTVVMYCLIVLETCVKNCGKRFHLLVSQKDFVQDLVKLIGPRNEPPTAVQEKVLNLIQSWADAFKNNPEMSGVVQVYNDLKLKGIEFPMTDLDSLAPIHTPKRTVPISQKKQDQPHMHQPHMQSPPLQSAALSSERSPGSVNLTPDQLAKLRNELDLVQGNMRVFGEMLTELEPGKEHPSDRELLQELHKTCLVMQNRIVELIDKIANEEVTNELLRVNDELNNLFLRYERFEKKRTVLNQAFVQSTQQPVSAPQSSVVESKPLIDFGDDDEAATGLLADQLTRTDIGASSTIKVVPSESPTNNLSGGDKVFCDEFDMFAQSRSMTYEKSKISGSTYDDNINHGQITSGLGSALSRGQKYEAQQEKEFEEMTQWLQNKPSEQDSLSSSEFDSFLAERAAAAEKLPSVPQIRPPSTAAGTTTVPNRMHSSSNTNRRKMDKDDSENALFAL